MLTSFLTFSKRLNPRYDHKILVKWCPILGKEITMSHVQRGIQKTRPGRSGGLTLSMKKVEVIWWYRLANKTGNMLFPIQENFVNSNRRSQNNQTSDMWGWRSPAGASRYIIPELATQFIALPKLGDGLWMFMASALPKNKIYYLWYFNTAIENGTFIVDLAIKWWIFP